jgi:predicted nuclease of predicted toxin-antitoxin system
MRLLADENMPRDVVAALRRAGHDVAWVREQAPGSSDKHVLEMAQAEQRIVLTFDKDFGELAFHRGLPATCGVVLFRVSTRSPTQTTATILKVIEGDTPNHRVGVVFTQTNASDRNELVALARAVDGTLTPAGHFDTGRQRPLIHSVAERAFLAKSWCLRSGRRFDYLINRRRMERPLVCALGRYKCSPAEQGLVNVIGREEGRQCRLGSEFHAKAARVLHE